MRPAGLGRSRAQSWNCESGVRWEVHVDTGGLRTGLSVVTPRDKLPRTQLLKTTQRIYYQSSRGPRSWGVCSGRAERVGRRSGLIGRMDWGGGCSQLPQVWQDLFPGYRTGDGSHS